MYTAILFIVLAADPQIIEGKCIGVTDGDTLKILVDDRQIKVRMAEIDAPEKRQPFGTKAREHLAGMVFGREIRVETSGKDRYGRTLGTVFVDRKNVNEAMVSDGCAWQYNRFSKSKRLEILEHDAREFKLGLWADPSPVAPRLWRKNRKRVNTSQTRSSHRTREQACHARVDTVDICGRTERRFFFPSQSCLLALPP